MEKIGFADLLVCPDCRSRLVGSYPSFSCSVCKIKFPATGGIPIVLPANFENSSDFFFKKSQIGFFGKWCRIKRKKKSALTAFEKFFSTEVGRKKVNYSEEQLRRMIKSLPKNSWVLELGCGAGEHSEFIAKQRKDINFIMIDISPKSVLETKERLKKSNLKGGFYFVVADAENLPFADSSFSGISAVMFFHHLYRVEKCFKEVKRTLKPKGICLVVDLLSDNPLVIFSRKIFRHFPDKIKQRFIDDYVLENGEIPDVRIHNVEELRKAITSSHLKIIEEESYDLFLALFGALGVAFPFLKPLMKEKVLNYFYNLEKKMLKNKFFSRFAGARTLWLST